jgi:hypothetical protein
MMNPTASRRRTKVPTPIVHKIFIVESGRNAPFYSRIEADVWSPHKAQRYATIKLSTMKHINLIQGESSQIKQYLLKFNFIKARCGVLHNG